VTPSRIHAILPRIAVALALPLLAGGVGAYVWLTRSYEVPEGSDVFEVAAGRWAWTTDSTDCTTEWHTISFSPDRQVMTITNSEPYERPDGMLDSVAVYDVVEHTRGRIRGAIRGETRLTADSQPVVWDLVLRSEDRYAWHRTDWIRGGLTREIQRCEAS
jgi:hypothetical protein